jgi:hypothetical protein
MFPHCSKLSLKTEQVICQDMAVISTPMTCGLDALRRVRVSKPFRKLNRVDTTLDPLTIHSHWPNQISRQLERITTLLTRAEDGVHALLGRFVEAGNIIPNSINVVSA